MTAVPGYISWSQQSTYNECPSKYKLRYLDKVPQRPGGALIGGSVVHKTIEVSENAELPDGRLGWWRDEEFLPLLLEEFQEQLNLAMLAEADKVDAPDKEAWIAMVLDADGDETEARVRWGAAQVTWGGKKSKEFPGGENLWWWRNRGEGMLKRYAAIRRRDLEAGAQVLPGDTERYVSVMMEYAKAPGGKLLIKGYIDQVKLATADGELSIRDWKTGYHRIGQELQLACYAWMESQASGNPMATRGEIVSLKGQNLDEAVKVFDLEPLVPLIEPKFRSFLDRLQVDEVFDPVPGYCSSCGVREFCAYGATLPAAEG